MRHWLEINPDNSYTYLGFTYKSQPTRANFELPSQYAQDAQWLIISGSAPDYTVDVDAAAKALDLGEIAAQEQREENRRKYRSRVSFANDLKADILNINDSKGWNATQVQNYLSNSLIQTLIVLLSNASLASAKHLLQASDLSVYYTDAEKQTIMDDIQN